MDRNTNSSGLIIGVILVLILLIGFAFVWVRSSSDDMLGDDDNRDIDTALDNMNPANQNNNNNANNPGTVVTTNSTTTTTTGSSTATAFTVNVSDLSSEQRTALTASGFEGDEIVITNAMKACAEQSIGVERTQAFADGEKPTVIEMGKLLVCYNK